jgi:hypothetical protein
MMKQGNCELINTRPKHPVIHSTISNLTTGLAGIAGGASLGAVFGETGTIAGAIIGGVLLYFLASLGNNTR